VLQLPDLDAARLVRVGVRGRVRVRLRLRLRLRVGVRVRVRVRARLEADGEEVLVAGHALELDGPRHALERQLEQQSQRRGRDDLHEPRAAAGREGHREQPAAGGG